MAKKPPVTRLADGLVHNVYPITITGLFFASICLPLIISLLGLKPSLVKAVVGWLCLIPVGPAVVATLATLHHYHQTSEVGLLGYAYRFFGRQFKEDWLIWLPLWLFSLPIGVYSQASLSQGPKWLYAAVPAILILSILAASLTCVVALIAAVFTFKHRDYWRLGIGALQQHPLLLFADLTLVLVAIAIGAWLSPLLLLLIASTLLSVFYVLNEPILAWITARFIHQ